MGKTKGTPPAVVATAVTVCEGGGELRWEPVGVALAAFESYDDTDDFAPGDNVRSWLMDTSYCTQELTTRAAIPTSHIELVTDANISVIFSTANYLTNSDKVVPQQTGALGEVA